MTRSLRLAAAVLLACVIVPSGYAQTIRGQLVDEATGLPIGGGFVVLLSDSAVERGRGEPSGSGVDAP